MTTKGLYQFVNFPDKPNVNLFIYCDCGLEGAALYFLNMYEHLDPFKGSAADTFHRVNEDCEFVGEISDNRTDIHYRYLIYPKTVTSWRDPRPLQVKAYRSAYLYEYQDNGWSLLYEGDLAEFVNKYAPKLLRLLEEGKERLSLLPIVSDRTQTNLYKEFYAKIQPPIGNASFYSQGFHNLQEAKEIATLLNLPERIHRQLQVIEAWYEVYLHNNKHDQNLLFEAIAIVSTMTNCQRLVLSYS